MDVFPEDRPCPADGYTLPLLKNGEHALLCKNGHGIISRFVRISFSRLFEALVGSVLSYGSASLVPTLTELRETDVEVNKMRRLATGTPLWNGHENTPTSALYRGDSKFSTQLRVSRAKLVGHLLRHDSPFQELILWNVEENARKKSQSDNRDLKYALST